MSANQNENDDLNDLNANSDVSEDETAPAVSSKQFGNTGSTKILFEKFFKVVQEKSDGQLVGKCLTCSRTYSTTEKATSNLTRHLVSSFDHSKNKCGTFHDNFLCF